METIERGVNLGLGQLGSFLVLLSFCSALVGLIAYFLATKEEHSPLLSKPWLMLGRYAFVIHTVSVIGFMVALIVLIQGHYFEYKYVWQHSSKSLPANYLFAAFWEGQEGSTMLWMFWTAILGAVFIIRCRDWESPVLTVVCLLQVMLSTMIMGIYFFDYKMGSSPFSLMKDVMDIPIFKMNPDYIAEDGSGLNPSLQNYWMVIHPPTLFLGFASVTFPFAFVLASLWRREYVSWVKAAFPWALFSAAILGTGILMGGAWAYESLSFGGFWAWDPVENASLVPWIILVGAIHTMLAYKHTGYSLGITYFMFILSFLLIQYSSFLTKSGILGDSSVHSFTDMGMSGQLVVSLLVFIIPSIVLVLLRIKEIPNPKKEESFTSREFFLFVSALIFFFSAVHIIVVTSFPVINKVFNSDFAMPSNIKSHYNNIQIWVAILISLGSAIGQFFIYKKSVFEKILKRIVFSFLLSVGIGAVIIFYFKLHRLDYILLTILSLFTIIANGQYIFKEAKGKFKNSGGSIAHIGIGIMLLGILISQSQQQVVSLNRFGLNYGDGFSEEENENNILLYENKTEEMNGYKITYFGDSIGNPNIFFKVKYQKIQKDGTLDNGFVLQPNIVMNKKMGNVANPDTKHEIHQDLYTHITSAPLKEDGSLPDSVIIESFPLAIGDTMKGNRCYAILDAINTNTIVEGIDLKPDDIVIGAVMRLITMDSTYNVEPKYFIRGNVASSVPAKVKDIESTLYFSRIMPEEKKIEITLEQKMPKYIIMKAIIFPWINLLWLGSLLMVVGFGISMLKRIGDRNRPNTKQYAID